MAKTINSKDLDIAPYIDHTLLNQTATPEEIQQFCYQAERYKFASVCVFPHYVKLAKELLQGKTPKVSTVIGFPTGATTSKVKLYEAQEAVENGATELDVVINLSWLKTGKSEELYQEIAEICDETGQTVKAIIETTILTEEEKRLAVEVLMDTGIAYIKTSTGWYGGATVADIQLIKSIAKGRVGIKASGGIRTYQQAVDLIIAGATRLGTSRGVEILTTEIQGEDSY